MLEDHHHSELAIARSQATKKSRSRQNSTIWLPDSLFLSLYIHTPLIITSPLDHTLNRRLWCFFTMSVFSGSGITQLANICRMKPFAQSHTQLRFNPHLWKKQWALRVASSSFSTNSCVLRLVYIAATCLSSPNFRKTSTVYLKLWLSELTHVIKWKELITTHLRECPAQRKYSLNFGAHFNYFTVSQIRAWEFSKGGLGLSQR